MDKNKIFLIRIMKSRSKVNITTVIKLAYFCDLWFNNENNQTISDYEYIRYYYWPFSEKIKEDIKYLQEQWYISEDSYIDYMWRECNEYLLTEKVNTLGKDEEESLNKKENEFMESILQDLSWFNAAQLWMLSYQTAPLKSIGAKPWGKEHFREKLDLNLK